MLRLEISTLIRGIPPLTPLELASKLHSLPPILYTNVKISVLNYSKAPWGLSVLLRVTSIFTGTSISPGALSRQCPNRFTFRAGQNLPDKEFRYLRTVIVTAAVYWGLSSKLRIAPNLSPWPSSTGQVSAPILHLSVLQRPVFLINSRLGSFAVAYSHKHPFSLSYGVFLPSSLTTLLPLVFRFSPRPPVSVYSTGNKYLPPWLFLTAWIHLLRYLIRYASRLVLKLNACSGFCSPRFDYPSVSSLRIFISTGFSTSCPSATAFALTLGPDLPRVV